MRSMRFEVWSSFAAAVLLTACAAHRYVPPDELLVAFSVDADIRQFAPGSWTLSIRSPAGKATSLRRAPFFECQRWHEGAWQSHYFHPTHGELPGRQTSFAPGEVWQFVPVHVGDDRPFAWRQELCDWRIVAYPGRYRCRVRWLLGTEKEFRFTSWDEFRVLASEQPASPLGVAQAAGGALWRDYTKFMDTPLKPSAASDPGFARRSSSQTRHLAQLLYELPPDLLGLEDAPAALRRRLRLAELLRRSHAVRSIDESERARHYAQLRAAFSSFAAIRDLYGELGALVPRVLGQRMQATAPADGEAVQLSSSARSVAMAYPTMVFAWGLSPPAVDPDRRGPRSSSLLQRRSGAAW